jgi:hypothetical protein
VPSPHYSRDCKIAHQQNPRLHPDSRVTRRQADGGELAGKVRVVSKKLVQLGELSGRDYYDGVIELDKISAVIVRVQE